MRKLDTSSITPSNGFPVKSGTLNHFQLAYQEAIAETVKGVIGNNYDAAKGYILNGCLNTGTGSNYIISAGSVYFNGEVYLVDPATFSISGSNVAVGIITLSFNSSAIADPVQFQDGVNRNVHQIRKIVFAPGLSGSGAVDYLAFRKTNSAQVPIGGVIIYIPQTLDLSEFSSGLGIAPNVLGYAIADGTNGTKNLKGMFVVGFDPADTDYNVVGKTGGEKAHTLNVAQIPAHHHRVGTQNIATDPTFNAGTAHTARSWNATPQDDTGALSSTDDTGGGLAHENRPPFYTVLYIQRIF